MSTENYYSLLHILTEVLRITDNSMRIHHTTDDDARYHTVEIMYVGNNFVNLTINDVNVNISFADIKLMDYDVEEDGLLNGFLHYVIDNHYYKTKK